MMVLDASAAIEFLLNSRAGQRVAARISGDDSLHAPHLIDLEIAQVLRRLCALGRLRPDRAAAGLDVFESLSVRRHAHQPLPGRIWQLRHHLTAYDACYVALAEGLDALLLTTDSAIFGDTPSGSDRSGVAKTHLCCLPRYAEVMYPLKKGKFAAQAHVGLPQGTYEASAYGLDSLRTQTAPALPGFE
jgi:predicted nucleic acid-binding protein